MKTVREASIHLGPDKQGFHSLGLCKKEYLSAIAMQGLLSSEWGKEQVGKDKYIINVNLVANTSVLMAEALINELNK